MIMCDYMASSPSSTLCDHKATIKYDLELLKMLFHTSEKFFHLNMSAKEIKKAKKNSPHEKVLSLVPILNVCFEGSLLICFLFTLITWVSNISMNRFNVLFQVTLSIWFIFTLTTGVSKIPMNWCWQRPPSNENVHVLLHWSHDHRSE